MKDGYYTVNIGDIDDWDCNNEFRTKEDAIKYGYGLEIDNFEVGQISVNDVTAIKSMIDIDIDDIFDKITEDIYDEHGEYVSEAFSNMLDEINAEEFTGLEKEITNILRKWTIEKLGNFKFTEIENVEQINKCKYCEEMKICASGVCEDCKHIPEPI